MATGQTIVDRALRLLGQIGSGEDPETEESDDAIESLTAMLDSWRNEKLMCYAFREETLTLANSDPSYTIGPGGDLDTTRPVSIERAWIVDSNTSYAVDPMTEEEYAAIPDKTTESDWPNRFLYRPSMATGTLIVYPEPNATRTMKLLTRVPLTSIALTDTVSLPPGWERALAYNLAIEIAPEYEAEPSSAVIKVAVDSKADIKRANSRPIKAYSELARMFPSGHSNINTGE